MVKNYETPHNVLVMVALLSTILVATGSISTPITQHVAAQSISIPTNTTQQASCDTAGSSSAVADSCNNKSTNNIANSGGVIDLTTQHKQHHHHTTITVIKHVINDNSGSAQASDFTINISTCGAQGKHIVASFPGSESGNTVEVDPAPCYFIDEDMPASSAGYEASFTGDCSTRDPGGDSNEFPVNEGDDLTCTITNNDVPPTTAQNGTITVTKHVINDNSGTLQASDVNIKIFICGTSNPVASFPGDESGTTVELPPASCYGVTEFIPATPTGYDFTATGDCSNSAGQSVGFPLNSGDHLTCTFTNNDRPPQIGTITVINHVINDGSGTAQASDFSMRIINCEAGQPPQLVSEFPGSESGTTVELPPASCYNIGAAFGAQPYVSSFTGDCNNVVLNVGDHKTCTVTNNDVG